MIVIGNIVAYNCDGNYQIAVRRDTIDAITLISTNGGQINLAYTGPGDIYQAGTVAVSLVPDRMFLKFGDDSNWKVGFGGGLRLGSETSTLLNVDVSYGDGIQVLVSTEPLQAFADRTKQL